MGEVQKVETAKFDYFPIEEGKVKALILDGVKHQVHLVTLPEHGDTVIHTHNGKGTKVKFVDEHLI